MLWLGSLIFLHGVNGREVHDEAIMKRRVDSGTGYKKCGCERERRETRDERNDGNEKMV